MDKTTMGVMGAITSLAAATAIGANAAPAPAAPLERAQSYAELLDPIPNAVERLALVNTQSTEDGARLIEAQYARDDGRFAHHHHHHHNNYVPPRRYYRHYYRHYHRRHVVVHHHHHHHHNNY